jgi:hypothetical protein
MLMKTAMKRKLAWAVAFALIYDATTMADDQADAWGEAVDGIRLHLAQSAADERENAQKSTGAQLPKFEVQLRNQGGSTFVFALDYDLWNIEIDGIWYRSGPFGRGGAPAYIELAPGDQRSDPVTAVRWDNLFEASPITSNPPTSKFILTLGRHRVRVRTTTANHCRVTKPSVRTGIVATSNMVIIDVPTVEKAAH